ncbi:MAG: metal ABC transporter permease [Chloroflexi bacterium]|nr:metal ABC transporter permease [Chloroflexota bacterium]
MVELLDALQQSYLQRAIVAGLLVGLICPTIGVFLVLRRLSLIGDGLGHVSFAGVAAGWLLGIYPLATAALFALAGAMGLNWLRARRREYGDLALALIFYSGIALGVVLTSLARAMNVNLFGYLFGSILTVSETDLLVIAGLGVLVLGVVFTFSKELFSLAYDEELAQVGGLPVGGLNALMAALAALTVVASLRVVGILLVAALLAVPVAAGLQLARSFRGVLLLAMVFGVISSLAGLAAAYALDLAPGGTIVLVAVLLYLIALAVRGPIRAIGWLRR